MLIYENCTYSWKNMDWFWTRSSIQSGVPCGKKTEHSSSVWTTTSRRRWVGQMLETERLSSERLWALSVLVWWCTEEQDGRRRRHQERVSILSWHVRRRSTLSPSSSRLFRTQSHRSYTTGKCVNSEIFLRVHLSYWTCNQFTLHRKLRIAGGQNSSRERQTVFVLYVCESHGQGSQRSAWAWLYQTTSCIVQAV